MYAHHSRTQILTKPVGMNIPVDPLRERQEAAAEAARGYSTVFTYERDSDTFTYKQIIAITREPKCVYSRIRYCIRTALSQAKHEDDLFSHVQHA